MENDIRNEKSWETGSLIRHLMRDPQNQVSRKKSDSLIPSQPSNPLAKATPTEIKAGPELPSTNGNSIEQILKLLGINYSEAMKDGKIEWSEAEKAGVSKELFQLITNNMDANATGTNEITEEELKKAVEVIVKYATLLGIGLDKAVEAYKSSKSFRNVDLVEVEKAKSEILTNLKGITSENYQVKINEHYPAVGKAIKSFMQGKTSITEKDFAEFLLCCAMGRLTGLYETLGIDKAAQEALGISKEAREALETAGEFKPEKVTKDNILEWLKTGKTIETGKEEKEGKENNESFQEAARNMQAAEGNLSKLESIWGSLSSALKQNPILAKTMFEAYLNNEKYNDAISIATSLKGNEKDNCLKMLYGKYKAQNNYDKAIEIIGQFEENTHGALYADLVNPKIEETKAAIQSSDFPKAEATLKTLKELRSKLADKGKFLEPDLTLLTFQLASQYIGSNDADKQSKAYKLIDELPNDAKIQSKEGAAISKLEAKFMLAEKQNDLEPMTINDQEATDIDKALAHFYSAEIYNKNHDYNKMHEQYKNAYETITKALVNDKNNSTFIGLKERIEKTWGNYLQVAQQTAPRNDGPKIERLEEERRKIINKNKVKLASKQGTTSSSPSEPKVPVANLTGRINAVLKNNKDKDARAKELANLLNGLNGKKMNDAIKYFEQVRSAGFTVNPRLTPTGNIDKVFVN